MEGVTLVLLSLIAVLMILMIRRAERAHQYWQNKGITFIKPLPFFGNLLPLVRGKISEAELFKKFYDDHPNEKYVGIYSFLRPNLLVRDPLIWRRIAQSNFGHFTDRGFEFRMDEESGMSHGITHLTGNKWRSMRAKLSPTFTTGRIKGMFDETKKCGLQMVDLLKSEDGLDRCLKSLYSFYTCLVVSKAVFGVELALRPDSEFVRKAQRVFEMSTLDKAKAFIVSNFPVFRDLLTVAFVPRDVSKYFNDILRKTIEARRNSNATRNDFVSILLELKGKGSFRINFHDPDDRFLQLDQLEDAEDFEFTDELLMGQAFLFLTAGLDTSSAVLEYLTFELARHPGVQEEARREVRAVLAKEELSYTALAKMEFLDKCIKECQRLYPVGALLQRECTQDIELEPGFWVRKGDLVTAPVYGYHMDPNLFPEPDKFRPEHFVEPEHGAYLPFGSGPRLCIGMRFAQMNIKLAACLILDNFKIMPSTKNKTPLRFDPNSLLMAPLNNLWARFEYIK